MQKKNALREIKERNETLIRFLHCTHKLRAPYDAQALTDAEEVALRFCRRNRELLNRITAEKGE